jgi:hypothetical protein
LTAGASARADESTNGAANSAAVPVSSARRFTSAMPNELVLDIASPKILAPNFLV